MVTVDKPGNAMHGNVWEWCSDWGGSGLSGGTDPVDPAEERARRVFEGSDRVFRGGMFGDLPHGCRSAYRHSRGEPSYFARNNFSGFRVARSQSAQ